MTDVILCYIFSCACVLHPHISPLPPPPPLCHDTSTYDRLAQGEGLSDAMIARFFTPFYQGIFLSPLKEQSSRMFEFVFQMFAIGDIDNEILVG